MNEDRFSALAGAYGGEIARWPVADREGAIAFAAAHPELAAALAGDAAALDAAMDAWPDADPGHDLRESIIAAAPRERRMGRLWRWVAGAGIGMGLAAAAASGVAAGAVLAPVNVTRVLHPGSPGATAANDPTDEIAELIAPASEPGEGA